MRKIVLALSAIFTVAVGSIAAQERYVRAELNERNELIITTSTGKRIVLDQYDDDYVAGRPVEFKQIAISDDGAAVGWIDYSPVCCTSYPVPVMLEVYKAGTRRALRTATATWHWCFIDGSDGIASLSSTLHGVQNEVVELWQISTGRKRDEFLWMDGESNPNAPPWVVDVRRAENAEAYQCSTSLGLEATYARRAESAEPANQLERALQQAFSAKNPKVTYAKVLELRSLGMGDGPYVVLGWGIRPDWKFEGDFGDELFGVFVVDNDLTKIEQTIDIFPTCRWGDCIVSFERVSWSGSEIVVAGSGSFRDGEFRKTYSIKPSKAPDEAYAESR